MKIKEIMNTNLKWVTPNTDLKKAAEIMQKYDVGVVPVCNDNQTLLGLVTDRDIVVMTNPQYDEKTRSVENSITKFNKIQKTRKNYSFIDR